MPDEVADIGKPAGEHEGLNAEVVPSMTKQSESRKDTRSSRFANLMVIACTVFWIGGWSSASAQSPALDARIREDAKRILSEPEFRYFKHLNEADDRPDVDSGSSGAGGQNPGMPGGSSGGKSSGGNPSPRQPNSQKEGGHPQSSSEDANGLDSGLSTLGKLGESISGVFGLLFHGLAYLTLLVVCGLIVYLIFQAILGRESLSPTPQTRAWNLDDVQSDDHSPGELPADAYLELARKFAQEHRYREAVAHLLLGGMSSIERADLIRHRRGLTLRDYLRALRSQPAQYAGFQSMIHLYEPVGFGRRIASYQTFQDALAGYEQVVA